jgi:hypothetical protein
MTPARFDAGAMARRTLTPSERATMSEQRMILPIFWLALSFLLDPAAVCGQTATPPDQRPPAQLPAERKGSLRMTPGVVCRSIAGYEDYHVLPKAAQTSDEKLMVYFRPLGYQTELVDGAYQVHLVPDFQIRKRGDKAVLLQKMRMFEYKARSEQPLHHLYMKNVISLKGLVPGDYDLTLTLHDEISKGPPATQVVRFRVIPVSDPEKGDKASEPDR